MPNYATWIVVANSALAKIFRLSKFPKIEELTSMEHPESRLHDQDLVSSKPGRAFESTGVRRSSYEPESDPKKLEIDKFARILGEYLCTSYQKGKFSRLYIMAGPSFLGMLRQHLNAQTQEIIVAELAKDMTEHKKEEIEQHLAEL